MPDRRRLRAQRHARARSAGGSGSPARRGGSPPAARRGSPACSPSPRLEGRHDREHRRRDVAAGAGRAIGSFVAARVGGDPLARDLEGDGLARLADGLWVELGRCVSSHGSQTLINYGRTVLYLRRPASRRRTMRRAHVRHRCRDDEVREARDQGVGLPGHGTEAGTKALEDAGIAYDDVEQAASATATATRPPASARSTSSASPASRSSTSTTTARPARRALFLARQRRRGRAWPTARSRSASRRWRRARSASSTWTAPTR